MFSFWTQNNEDCLWCYLSRSVLWAAQEVWTTSCSWTSRSLNLWPRACVRLGCRSTMTSSGKRARQSSSPSWGCWTTWWVNPDLLYVFYPSAFGFPALLVGKCPIRGHNEAGFITLLIWNGSCNWWMRMSEYFSLSSQITMRVFSGHDMIAELRSCSTQDVY